VPLSITGAVGGTHVKNVTIHEDNHPQKVTADGFSQLEGRIEKRGEKPSRPVMYSKESRQLLDRSEA
jgi:hypothetical protein